MTHCSRCGNEIGPGTQFCEGCGQSVVGPVGGSNPPPTPSPLHGRLRKIITLRGDEHPEHIWRSVISQPMPPGRRNLQRSIPLFVVLTDQRLIMLERGGFFRRHLEPFDEIELETIKGTTIREGFVGNTITITAEAVSGMKKVRLRDLMDADQVTLKRGDYTDMVGFQALMDRSIQVRRSQMDEGTGPEVGQVPIDFQILRERMAKGGLVVQAFPCPNCGPILDLPAGGHETRCHNCQATVHAEDLLARLNDTLQA